MIFEASNALTQGQRFISNKITIVKYYIKCNQHYIESFTLIIMQASQPHLIIPISLIKQIFDIPIFRVKSINGYPTNYYEAITAYGSNCLIIQQSPNNEMSVKDHCIHERNRLISANKNCFPLIFEQQMLKFGQNNYHLTLLERCDTVWNCVHEAIDFKIASFTKLIQCLSLIEQKGYKYNEKLTGQKLLYLKNSQQLFIDITKIQSMTQKSQNRQLYLKMVIECMMQLLAQKYRPSHQIRQIVFIQGKIYTFQPSKLQQANSYQILMIFMNVCQDMQVKLINKNSKPKLNKQKSTKPTQQNINQIDQGKAIISPSKPREVKLKTLDGNPIIQINQVKYDHLFFEDGKCINCLREVFYEQLSNKFIHQNSLYKLQQFEHLTVHIVKNQGGSRNQEIITVYPPVSKVELISFLIAYIRCIDPTVLSLEYSAIQNSLRIRFLNKKKQNKILIMIFYEDYVVKDEEISMILEKSNLHKCKLDLKQMKINDTFLIFLAHFQKAQNISELHLTDTYGISDIGLSTLFKSPQSQNIQTFSLSAVNPQNPALQQSIELISSKKSLKRLYLKKQLLTSSAFSEQIDVSKLNLIELQSIGVKLTLQSVVQANLKVLKLDQIVSVEQLKNIKHLKLVELKVRLTENKKKSLIDSISSFSSLSSLSGNKSNLSRIFAQGQSKNTLKRLDISFSNCKFKTIRPLLMMKELETIILDDCTNLGNQFECVSGKILSISVANTELGVEEIINMLSSTKQLVELNISNTKIGKYDIIKLVLNRKMAINNLILSQGQYTNRLLDTTNGYELIDCIQLQIDRFLQPEQEYSFNLLLSKAVQSRKTLRFRTKLELDYIESQNKNQLLISRVNKFLIMSNLNIDSLQNIYSNKTKISELLQIQQSFQVQDFCQSIVASSITISADRCRIASQPKVLVRKSNQISIQIKALPKQTIDKFTHRFVKLMQTNQKLISVDLSQNRLIGKEIIKILLKYGKNHIRELNFQGCLFTFNDIVQSLFQFSHLQIVNKGINQINLNKQNFDVRSQKYLKFFMRLREIKSIKIQCQQVEELQIFYSVLSHILDHCCSQIYILSVTFHQIKLNKQSLHFLNTLFSLKKLTKFQYYLRQCSIDNQTCSQIWNKGLNQLKQLEYISLSMPSFDIPQISLPKLIDVSLQFNDGLAEEGTVNKVIRNLTYSKQLRVLKISVANCSNISNLNRMFGVLPVGNIFQKTHSLEHIFLNFEYCQLKEQSLYQCLGIIVKCQSIKYLELNVSFAITNFGDFVGCIQKLADEITKPLIIKIFCITENSNSYMVRTQNLSQKGIEFIL